MVSGMYHQLSSEPGQGKLWNYLQTARSFDTVGYDHFGKPAMITGGKPRCTKPKMMNPDTEKLLLEGKFVGWMHAHP